MQGMQETQVWPLGREDQPGGGKSSPLQCCFLGDSMDRGAWQATVHRVGHKWAHVRTERAGWVLFSDSLHTASTSIQSNTCMPVRSLLLPHLWNTSHWWFLQGSFFFFAKTILKLTNLNLPYFGTTTKGNLDSPNHLAFTKQTVLLSLSFGKFLFIHLSLAATLPSLAMWRLIINEISDTHF